MVGFLTTHTLLGGQFAENLGLDPAVQDAIHQAYEQWDGNGYPDHLRGDEICLPARLVQLAGAVEVHSRRHGLHGAVQVARKHRGTNFDPDVVDMFCAHAAELLDDLDQAAGWAAVLDAEPNNRNRVRGADLDRVLEATADTYR